MSDQPESPLAAALAAVQADLPRVGKGNTAKVTSDKGGYSYKYADLADVSAAILPVLGKHGLSWSCCPTLVDGHFVLAYSLSHASGEERTGIYPLPANASPQQMGSHITYARRYALCAVTGIAPDGDDDGQAANEGWEADQAIEQQISADAWQADIEAAKTVSDLTRAGNGVRQAMRSGRITKAAYDRLVQLGTARRAEIDQVVHPAPEPAEEAQ